MPGSKVSQDPTSSPKPSRTSSHRSRRSSQRTEIKINVYDLLPPSRLASVLWYCGTGLLHSGVVVRDREYAYGGHDKRGLTGVYYTRPRQEPPGGTWRSEVLQGVTYCTDAEIEAVIKEASHRFLGTSYNLLTKNCNHFTSYLCEKLTGRPAPSWLNRAASIGVALPCVVPREWVVAPDHETADGDLVDDGDDDVETTRMLRRETSRRPRVSREEQDEWSSEVDRISRVAGSSDRNSLRSSTNAPLRDTSGRGVPPSERAPLPAR